MLLLKQASSLVVPYATGIVLNLSSDVGGKVSTGIGGTGGVGDVFLGFLSKMYAIKASAMPPIISFVFLSILLFLF
jgi:hypothetical protein